MNRYLKLPLDKTKRHFIVGDIHGKYKGLLRLLYEAGYEEKKGDIVYTVGDQLDRGWKSMEVIRFFQEENRYTIMGNHEAMAIDPKWFDVWLNNDGDTGIHSIREHGMDSVDFIPMFQDLPYLIDVGEDGDSDAFRIVHAEVPVIWGEELLMKRLEDGDEAILDHLIWSRQSMTAATHLMPEELLKWAKIRKKANPRRVFCGHTPIPGNPQFVGNQLFLDTGYKSLTCVEAMSGAITTIQMEGDEIRG